MSCDQLNLLVPFLETVGIPVINIRLEPCYLPETATTQVLHYSKQESDYSMVLSDVLDMLNWGQFIVVYDESHGEFLCVLSFIKLLIISARLIL